MTCPADCPTKLFETVMLPCWNADPAQRPSFKTIFTSLVSYLQTEDLTESSQFQLQTELPNQTESGEYYKDDS